MTFRHCTAALLSCLLGFSTWLLPTAATAQTSVTGQWVRLNDLPFGPIHEQLLPDGRVLLWGRDAASPPKIFDPLTQALSTPASPGYDQFCSGHAYLADQRILVAGGHVQDLVGLPDASLYDTATNLWTAVPDMNAGRWYPTVTTLANGDALVVSGQIDTTSGVNTLPQVYQAATNTWRSLTNAQLAQDLYPMMFLAPNGRVLNVAPTVTTRYLDTSGTGSWTVLGDRAYGYRDYGSAVMYDTGKILVVGGGDPPNGTAEIIDLNAASPAWRFTGYMSQSRRQLNTTLLPDGTVLTTGGTYGNGFNNTTTPVYAAELWNPATELWTQLASASTGRFYHSSALLLPDARVLSVGGDDNRAVEIFSPPYLFKGGTRPSMSAVPATINYGQQFSVQSPDASGISKVTLIRMPNVTHAFDQNTRLNVLQYTVGSGALDITAPANANLAPPGLYMLFIVNGIGVPSVASMVKLTAGSATVTPPTLTSLSPNSATAGGAAFTLTVNGSNFVSGATVNWNGAPRTTTFVSATQVTAAIPASDIAAAGTPQVTAINPGSAASNALTFTVSNPTAPSLTSLSPNSATAGGAAFTLTVNGSNFVSGATVRWNGAARTTTFVSATQVTAAIPASDVAAAGTAQVAAINPGSAASNALTFTVSNPAAPSLTSLSPNSATAGGAAFTLTVNGSNFVSGATVRWNGAARTTTFVSATQVTAAIPASDIAAAGTAQVAAINPGSSASNALTFTVSNPTVTAPSLTSLSPNSATAGGAAFTLTVNGSNFVSGATVNWNGAPRTTTFVSATQVTAAIPASDVAAAGTAQVAAINPGSSASNALTFTVSNPQVQTFTVGVSTTGAAASRGVITSSPAGISCNSSCSAAFATGTIVTLTVKTNGNGVFGAWGGACSGTGACTVTMDANKTVTATINRR